MSNTLASLRRKFPGFEHKLNRMVTDMADQVSGVPSLAPRGWISVRPADPTDALDALAQTRWHAFLHARLPDGQEITMPVVPDEHNPRADKVVRPDDLPHVFRTMGEAEAAANAELPGLLKHLAAQIP